MLNLIVKSCIFNGKVVTKVSKRLLIGTLLHDSHTMSIVYERSASYQTVKPSFQSMVLSFQAMIRLFYGVLFCKNKVILLR